MPTDVEIPIYKNKSLADLPGEIWKDIKGFEGSYQASNLGRIKSLDRTIAHPRLKEQFVKGRIISFSIAKNKNIKTGDPMIDLRVALSNDARRYDFNVRRVIYKTFVAPRLDFKKNGKYVINIDGNGYNNHVSNLKLVTKREKQRRITKRKRVDFNLVTADRSQWPKTYGGYSRRKPVVQKDLAGNLVAEFESISEASRQTKLGQKEIIQVAKGRWEHYKGFIWMYA